MEKFNSLTKDYRTGVVLLLIGVLEVMGALYYLRDNTAIALGLVATGLTTIGLGWHIFSKNWKNIC